MNEEMRADILKRIENLKNLIKAIEETNLFTERIEYYKGQLDMLQYIERLYS